MRAAPGFHVEWVEDEAVVLDANSGQFHYLNPPAALVYALILEHGFDKAMEELEHTRGQTPETDPELGKLIDQMKALGFLVDE